MTCDRVSELHKPARSHVFTYRMVATSRIAVGLILMLVDHQMSSRSRKKFSLQLDGFVYVYFCRVPGAHTLQKVFSPHRPTRFFESVINNSADLFASSSCTIRSSFSLKPAHSSK